VSRKNAPERDDIEYRVLNDSLELRVEGPDRAPRLVGWSPIWNSLSVDLGGFRERVLPGATSKTIREQTIPLLVNHAGLPLASSASGTLTLTEDDRGLRFETDLDTSDPDVQRLLPKMRRGDLNKTSFAFREVKGTWDTDGKVPVRVLQEIRLYDVSVVAQPAYPQTEAKLRSLFAASGIELDDFPRLVLRIQRGLVLTDDDRALLRSVIEHLSSYLPGAAAAVDEPNDTPAEPAPTAGHSEAVRREPARTGHSLEECRRRLEAIEARFN
jgi:HK97 family phage prohead protease